MVTPDDFIILDALIYGTGNQTEIESWEKIKTVLKKLAHDRIEGLNELGRRRFL